MKYDKKVMDEFIIITPEGRIDMSSSPEFESLALKYLQKKQDNLILDFSNTTYISSAGLRVLLTATKEANSVKKKIYICGVSETIQKVLDTSGFSTFLTIHANVADIVG